MRFPVQEILTLEKCFYTTSRDSGGVVVGYFHIPFGIRPSKTDFGARCVQLWIRSAGPPRDTKQQQYIRLSVRSSVHRCSPFPMINWVVFHGISSSFASISLSGMNGMEFLMGNSSISNTVTALVGIEKDCL